MMTSRRNWWWIVILAMVLGAQACGDEEAPAEGVEEGLDAEGCEHMEEGPAVPITAAADPAAAPDATAEHARVDIALAPDGTGIVTYAAEAPGDYTFYFDKPVDLTITAPDGSLLALESSAPVDLCEAVAVKQVFELALGLHTIALDASGQAEVRMVVEAAGEHEDE